MVVVVVCCFYVLLVGRVSCYSSLPRYLMFVMLLCYYVMVVLVSDVRWVCIVVSCVMCRVCVCDGCLALHSLPPARVLTSADGRLCVAGHWVMWRQTCWSTCRHVCLDMFSRRAPRRPHYAAVSTSVRQALPCIRTSRPFHLPPTHHTHPAPFVLSVIRPT